MYTNLQLQYLERMGIPAWQPRVLDSPVLPGTSSVQVRAESSTVSPVGIPGFADWLGVQPLMPISDGLQRCFVMGPAQSSILILSDAPLPTPAGLAGTQPFTTAAARLLDAMLKAIGHSRATCRIGSLVIPGLIDEYCVEQLLNDAPPKVLLQFIHPGVNHHYPSVEHLREQSHELNGSAVQCVVSYHPEFLLSNPALKREAWNDLKYLSKIAGPSIGGA